MTTMGVYCALILCVFLFDGVTGDGVVTMAVMEGKSVHLSSAVTKTPQDKMLWYFNDTLIALINGEKSKSCVYYGEGEIFKDRLEVDYTTGSLTITEIRPEHTGRYEGNLIKTKSSGTSQSLNRTSKCDGAKTTKKTSNIGDSVTTLTVSVTASLSGLDKTTAESFMEKEKEKEKKSESSLSLIIGICSGVGVVLLVAAVLGVKYCHRRSSNKEDTKEERTESSSERLLKIPV